MQFLRATAITSILSLVLVSQTGCIAVAAAAGAGAGVAYATGDTNHAVDGTPQEVSAAAEQALMQMGMVVISNSVSAVDATVIARTGRDKKVEVTAKVQTERRSVVSIRVGVFGDEMLQRDLLDKIKENLASMPAETSSVQTDN